MRGNRKCHPEADRQEVSSASYKASPRCPYSSRKEGLKHMRNLARGTSEHEGPRRGGPDPRPCRGAGADAAVEAGGQQIRATDGLAEGKLRISLTSRTRCGITIATILCDLELLHLANSSGGVAACGRSNDLGQRVPELQIGRVLPPHNGSAAPLLGHDDISVLAFKHNVGVPGQGGVGGPLHELRHLRQPVVLREAPAACRAPHWLR
mmetsp:Transcript_38169/g.122696  ORF Transcript_38169/g.122696 Transcript_38169/m.122696 type:complete len:208 (-) Transcript_38169:2734-3357(-)